MMTSSDTTKDAKEIRSLIARWAEAVCARDMGGILVDRSEDIVMFDVPPPTQLRGIRAYEDSWTPFFRWLDESGTFEVSDISVHAGGDVAFATALVRCSREKEDGDGVEPSVRLTLGLRKFGGAWKVVHEHHSVPAK